MTVVTASKKSRHFCNHIVVVVGHVQINSLVFVWATVNNVVAVLFRNNDDLIVGQIRLKPFGFFNSARAKGTSALLWSS